MIDSHGNPVTLSDVAESYAAALRREQRLHAIKACHQASMKKSPSVKVGRPFLADPARDIVEARRLAYIGDTRAIEDVSRIASIPGCDEALRAETHFRARSSVLLAIARRRRVLREAADSLSQTQKPKEKHENMEPCVHGYRNLRAGRGACVGRRLGDEC